MNGSETEPASAKDRLLLARLPHLVLDGAVLAARAVGSSEVIVKVGAGSPDVVGALESAVSVREQDSVSIQVVTGPDGYVSGEESAVVHYLNGGGPLPTFVPPRPFERGFRGKPDADPEPRDAGAAGARRPLRLTLVPRARDGGRSRLGAGHDHRRGRRSGRLRARVRDLDG